MTEPDPKKPAAGAWLVYLASGVLAILAAVVATVIALSLGSSAGGVVAGLFGLICLWVAVLRFRKVWRMRQG